MDFKEGKQGREGRGGKGMEEDGNGWMDGVAGGGGIIIPDTTHHKMEEGRNREDDLKAEVLT